MHFLVAQANIKEVGVSLIAVKFNDVHARIKKPILS